MKNIKQNQSFAYLIAAASLILLVLSFAYLPTDAMSYENVQANDYDSLSVITSDDTEDELTSTTLTSSMQQDFSDPMSAETTSPLPSTTIAPFQSTTTLTTTNQNTVNACSDIGANIYIQPSGTSSCPFPLTQIQLSVVKYNAIQCFFLPMGQFQIPLRCIMDNSASASTFGLSNPFSSTSPAANMSTEETFDYTFPPSPIPSLPNTMTP